MARYTPPMYHRPQRKVPTPSKVVVPPPVVTPVAPLPVAAKPVAPSEKTAPKDQLFKPNEKQTKLLKPKSTKAPKVKEWSESMTQREIYKFAKDAGLQVVTRDPKAWVIKLLRKAHIPEKT